MLPIPSAQSSASAHLPYGLQDDSPATLIQYWQAWAARAPAGRAELRDQAVLRLQECLRTGQDGLMLDGLGLHWLPDVLPPQLLELDASDNQLIALPANLPTGLKRLIVPHNRLARLPAVLPAGLEQLVVNDNRLTAMPALPASLNLLFISGNPLHRLPHPLPPSLATLIAHHIGLADIDPAQPLPPSLRWLVLSANSLRHVPEVLLQLPRPCVVELGRNPLPLQSRLALANRIAAAGYDGPRFELRLPGAAAPAAVPDIGSKRKLDERSR